MNLADLYTQLADRITGDTGSGGLYNATTPLVNGVFFDVPFGGAAVPFILIRFIASDEADVFTKDAVDVSVEFEIVIERREGTLAVDSAILDRHRQKFHRWTPTLSGAYTGTDMRRVTGTTGHDELYRRYIEQYRIRVEWNTVGPV